MRKFILVLMIQLLILSCISGCTSSKVILENATTVETLLSASTTPIATPIPIPTTTPTTTLLSTPRKVSFTKIKENIKTADTDMANAITLVNSAFVDLEEYLKYSQSSSIPSIEIAALSDNIHIFEWGNSRIIQYIQSPELFGNSSRGCWQLFQYKMGNTVYTVQKDATISLDNFRIIERDSKLILYTYGIDYQVNMQRIYIRAYKFDANDITEISAIKWDNQINSICKYDEASGLIYPVRRDILLKIDSVSDDGEVVVIERWDNNTEGDRTLKLKLNREGFYTQVIE